MAELPGLRALSGDLRRRRDLRARRIFSIDPPTARDLDDALSVEALPDGSFEVGVHIADVSHFVRSDRHCQSFLDPKDPLSFLDPKDLVLFPNFGVYLSFFR